MRAVVQRVTCASVTVDQKVVGQIGEGLLVLLGIHTEDTEKESAWLAEKIATLRIFADDEGKMNRSLLDVAGEMLVVSQFTLYGDCRKGRRPSFVSAAHPEVAIPLYDKFIQTVQALGIRVQTGEFGAQMQVELINDGPVTLIVSTDESI